ncbi:MAG TPA: glycoside hydrolase family 16 protein [Pyrinomonadaceae bacterium]|jgi:beta-glucanase (GH16 family)|nr:glycoside hydrolase family 16 protein [Pyrinomonadaceae bacterium]
MTIASSSRRISKGGILRSCVALLGLLLFSAATNPVYAVGGTFFDGLDSFDTVRWQKADNWTNGDPFNVGWRADHITFSSGFMSLRLDTTPCSAGCSGKPYASGEYRTSDVYGYGKYETRFKAAKGSGLVTSFFTYTGTFGTSTHHEIDIEILGKDTTKMQTNYFVAGVGNHEHIVDLGFDSSAGYHNYAFVWTANKIEWIVDDVVVHTEYAGAGKPMPSQPGKIMANMWAGINVDSWLGPFSYPGTPIYAKYDWIQYFVL